MGELIHRETATTPLPFTGERLTGAISGQIEIEHYHRYLLAREFCRGRDVLDVAAGEGYGAALLAQVARAVIGVEVDPDTVAAARAAFPRPNLRFEQGDARAIPLPDECVDVAVSFETLEHLAEQDQFLSELRRVLRPGGVLIISTPDRDTYSPLGSPPNPFHVLELTRAEFEALIRQHFAHAAFAAQRALIGSVILGGADQMPLRSYEKRGDTRIEASQNLARAPYLVALASDAKLPPLPNSVFVSRGDLDTDPAVRFQAEMARRDAEAEVARLGDALAAARERAEGAEAAEAAGKEAEAAVREVARATIADLEERLSASVARAELAEAAVGLLEGKLAALVVRADHAVTAVGGLEEQLSAALVRADAAAARQAETEQQLAVAVVRADLADTRKAVIEQQLAAAVARGDNIEQQLLAAAERAVAGQNREANARAVIADLTQRLGAVEASAGWRAVLRWRAASARFPFVSRNLRRCALALWWTVTFQLFRRYRLWRDNRRRRNGFVPTPRLEQPAPGAATRAADFGVPSSPEPVVSVIIATHGQVPLTLACLRSIADHPPVHPIEVIVVDDAYAGPEDVGVLGAVAGIQLIRNETNLGFLLSCNTAATAAKGRYLLMLNNDTEVRDGAIDALVDLLEARLDAGMAGAKLLFPDGRLQEAGGILWSDASGWNYGRGEDPSRCDYNYVREVDYCSGAALMIRRSLFAELDGFDKDFAPAYYEDSDLAFRVRARGLKVLYEPRAVVIHHEGMSHGTDLSAGVKRHQVINQARMLDRWGPTLARENYPNGQHVLRARDRARDRAVVLVIDHYILEPDRDAGSRSTLAIIDSLLDAGWLVKFWPHNRAYSPVYTTALERRGIEVLDHRWPGTLDAWLAENAGELDHVLVNRPNIAADVLGDLTRHGKPVLSFYGHDLHFARLRREADLTGGAELAEESARTEQMERFVWSHFDVVLYPSEEEAATVRAMAPGTLARGIVPFSFDDFPARDAAPAGQTLLFVAGFAHPPNVDAAVFLVSEILPRLRADLGDVKVVLAGSNPTAAVRALAGPDVAVTGYVTDAELGRLYDSHRVSVVPLRFGAGVKGKVVESLSRGLPLVTTSVGAQGIPGLDEVVPVHDDVAGIVAALTSLLTDDAAWLAQSAGQMAFARRCFSRAALQRSVLSALAAGAAAAGERDAAVRSGGSLKSLETAG